MIFFTIYIDKKLVYKYNISCNHYIEYSYSVENTLYWYITDINYFTSTKDKDFKLQQMKVLNYKRLNVREKEKRVKRLSFSLLSAKSIQHSNQ